jgi:hypothetical protein
MQHIICKWRWALSHTYSSAPLIWRCSFIITSLYQMDCLLAWPFSRRWAHYSLCLMNETLSDTFFLARGPSSGVLLWLCAHSTSRNSVPVAAPQQARLVHVGLLTQSLHPSNWRFSLCPNIFHSTKLRSAFIVPDLPSLTHIKALTEL